MYEAQKRLKSFFLNNSICSITARVSTRKYIWVNEVFSEKWGAHQVYHGFGLKYVRIPVKLLKQKVFALQYWWSYCCFLANLVYIFTHVKIIKWKMEIYLVTAISNNNNSISMSSFIPLYPTNHIYSTFLDR